METELSPSDLERRKKVKLRVRGDLAITPQKYEGKTYYVVKDPVSLRYYRFKEQEYFLINYMNGRHTLDDAQKEFEKRFRPDRLTLEDLEQFGQQLLTAGLAQNESPNAGKQLFDRRKKRRRMEILQTFTNILYIKIPIFDPEKVLTKMLPYTRFIFSLWFFFLSCAVMLGAVLLVLTHFQTFRDRLPSYQEFFSFKTIFYLWAALGVVKVIHEFGHGLSCKAFGGEVHEMGFLFLCFSPAMYCNVSDAWTLPSKWQRMVISGAGIYVELMIAAIATFVWWNTPGQPFVNYMALSLMVVCSVSTVVFNGNPLMRFDGYYVLADWLEIPNLRDRSNKYIQRLMMEHALGIEVQPEPYMELGRRILFVSYAVVSYIYRWVVTYVILVFMASFLKPYKLEIVSTMLAAAAAGSMIGWPLFRLLKNIHKRGRLPDMKPVRVMITATILGSILFVFFFVPLSFFSRVRETGMVQVQPWDLVPVAVEVPATLEKIHVKEGQVVAAGALLADFSSLDLRLQYDEAFATYTSASDKLKRYEQALLSVRKEEEKNRIKDLHNDALGRKIDADGRLDQVRKYQAKLQLRAPRAGVVMGLPKIEEIGKRWEVEQGLPFCSIGDPAKLRVLVPVTPSDYDLVRQDFDKRAVNKEHVPVTIRIIGRDSKTWTGVIDHLPRSEAKDIPPALANKLGGPLATKPSQNPNELVPQAQVYLVGIAITNPDGAIAPGTLAQVKIHVEPRSAAWLVWRSLSLTFDLGLL